MNYDTLATNLHEGSTFLKELPFELYSGDINGTLQTVKYKGAWLLVDNGYHSWAVTVPPLKCIDTRPEWRFSKWLESNRKDVECTFGILKGRWRILKTGIRLNGTNIADEVWKTCCALHNWLLEVDGLDSQYVSDWAGSMGDVDEDASLRSSLNAPRNNPYDFRGPGDDELDDGDSEDEIQEVNAPIDEEDNEGAIYVHKMGMADFRSRLIKHFEICFRNGKISWPKARLGFEEPPPELHI